MREDVINIILLIIAIAAALFCVRVFIAFASFLHGL